MNPLTQIYTPSEAAKLWGITNQRIINACNGNNIYRQENLLVQDIECRLAEGIWLTTRAGLLRVFGEPLTPFTDPTDHTCQLLTQVVTIAEAVIIINRSKSTLLIACSGRPGKQKPSIAPDECRRSGTTWLILRSSLKQIATQITPKPRKTYQKQEYDFEQELQTLGSYTSNINPLTQIYTTAEAAKIWGLTQQDIINAYTPKSTQQNKLPETEFRKSGATVLLTRIGLIRLFGAPRIPFQTPTDQSSQSITRVITITEAMQITKKDRQTLTLACNGNTETSYRFTSDECRRSGTTWLITYDGLQRKFSDPNRQLPKSGPKSQK